jgi:alpha-N-arabinofuranosidase
VNAVIHLHTEHRVAPVDENISGGLLEHFGRAVYGAIDDPGSPLSDERGFRTDVIEALMALRLPVVRYPGGNFVSAYDWRDGVGPRSGRPRRPDVAWRTVESNQFGTDEFMQWCDAIGTKPMMAVNLGTGSTASAGRGRPSTCCGSARWPTCSGPVEPLVTHRAADVSRRPPASCSCGARGRCRSSG